ncbi:hypothetical protein TELCIR_05457 [Teladorsagia circumcincta]|uniref:7TM GPCR serpentine receptor class x (Srx) domain-containing protein n=1 Tax=Teladorsagia circumcincta TaxID=45464 RepID=A0A2G9UQS8_TELCI|nr:hypothetical protein TELCIR_05457 [Teladorsagia circumcincta]
MTKANYARSLPCVGQFEMAWGTRRRSGNVDYFIGICFIIYGITAELLYVVVLQVIARKQYRRLSCYKIMLVLGLWCGACMTCFVLVINRLLDLWDKQMMQLFFLQSSSICMANLIAALIYVYMQFFPTPSYFVLVGHICWQLGHGTVPNAL